MLKPARRHAVPESNLFPDGTAWESFHFPLAGGC